MWTQVFIIVEDCVNSFVPGRYGNHFNNVHIYVACATRYFVFGAVVVVCQWLEAVRWFSPDTPISSTKTIDRHHITEVLLKVVLSTKILTPCFAFSVQTKILSFVNGVIFFTLDSHKNNSLQWTVYYIFLPHLVTCSLHNDRGMCMYKKYI